MSEPNTTYSHCRSCGGKVSTRIYNHIQKVGRWTVKDGSSTAPQCEVCKEPQMSLDDLHGYQMRAVKTVLCDGHAEGDVVRYARKAVGLTQKELADILGYTHETVSRWENDRDTVPRSAAQALIGVLLRAIAGEDPQDILESARHALPPGKSAVIWSPTVVVFATHKESK